jgi:hypothetical protein
LNRKSLFVFFSLLWLAASGVASAQTTKAQLEVSETLFSLGAALNSCGYDDGLEGSLALRAAVRSQLQGIFAQSPQAAQARDAICQFWKEHQASEGSGQSQATPYVSLALELGPPPLFAPAVAEADLPPDAAYVLGVAPLLAKFYQAAALHALWLKHQPRYQSLVLQFHDPVSDTITQTDRYLKLPFSSNYPGQRFAVFLEPLLAPGQVNARNYANSYLVVVTPNQDGVINLEAIRHTYLHFVLEPLALTHGASLKRLEPILEDVHAAPARKEFKNDISLMVDESLIRAIEARMTFPRSNESARDAYVQRAMAEGFVLTHYFYQALAPFEKESTGMKDSYGDLLHNIDLEHERKRAREVQFASQATPEVVSASKPFSASNLLDAAEQKLAAGDLAEAQKLAQQVVERNNGGDEPGRAAFILARVATLSGNMQEARLGFQQAAQSLHDARLLAWSHIYLGRILDIQEEREAALAEYRAALAAGDPAADTKAAAEKGLAAPYQSRVRK